METILSAVKGALLLCAQLFIIIVPLTMFYEFLKTRQALLAHGRCAIAGISAKGLIPLATGIIIGITYGAGVIIHSIRSTDIKKGEASLILLYLSVCHAVIEDTLIFVVIGANGVVLLGTRFFLASVLTYASYKMGLFRRDSREFPQAAGSSEPDPPL